MGNLVLDIQDLYKQNFGGNPVVPDENKDFKFSQPAGFVVPGNNAELSQILGSKLIEKYNGIDVWLPTWFRDVPDVAAGGTGAVFFPWSVIRISNKKDIVKTPMAERKGTVKEIYSISDYEISIKGFLIDKNRVWPEKEISDLKKLYELQQAVRLDNALTNLFLDKDDRVLIASLDIPEVEGGRKHVRPFSMTMDSDSIFTLEIA